MSFSLVSTASAFFLIVFGIASIGLVADLAAQPGRTQQVQQRTVHPTDPQLAADLDLIQAAAKSAPAMIGEYLFTERKASIRFVRDPSDPKAMDTATVSGTFREIPAEGLFELPKASHDRPDGRGGRVIEQFSVLFDRGHVSSRRSWINSSTGKRVGVPISEDSTFNFELVDNASGPASGQWIAAEYMRQRFNGSRVPGPPGIVWVTTNRVLRRQATEDTILYYSECV